MKKIVVAALVVSGLLAAPAHAGPTVTVRVEGEARTLVPRTAVTTTDTRVGKPGQPTCSGTSALGALDVATGGDWAGPYDAGFQTYSIETLKGETHDVSTSSYWPFWINYTYASMGVCGQQIQEGDDLLFMPECYAAGCSPASPLRITGVPATTAPGATVTVKVVEYTPPQFPSTATTSAPAAGATVTFDGRTASTGADGGARVSFSGAGPKSLRATKPGRVRSATESICVTTGGDGHCGSRLPAGPGGPAPGPGGPVTAVDDTTAPVASFARLQHGKVYRRKRAPRRIAGTVTPDPSGLLSVRLSILRKRGDRCWTFDGASERFERHRCGGRDSFRIGDRADWSYLLPARLRRGRYTIRATAIDRAGNDSSKRVVIRVR